ncbi:hypothetical protein DFA_02442 [Cavenderia fasciculata]|uniref:LRAT domain-containing protein n=1 Tax=Cavenderia fasciculata TaxID=261658 RepID=F4PZG5_CACFS|nr:uncharacterized protein DFA_02442 [Cavenderia fasciculata]EGG19194.1 hypothetical protein DFA_02442 [Cavenderia fasciculata]|eukprot:XP_004366827.1 hypothetical protein DFA_02442 [Cavenderia fasciculata]
MRSSQLTELIELYQKNNGQLEQDDCHGWTLEHIAIKRMHPLGQREYEYFHHGVRIYYQGEFFSILHFSGLAEEVSLESKKRAKILFVGSSKQFSEPSHPNEIIVIGKRVSSADSMMRLISTYSKRNDIVYNLVRRNCEHVSTYIIDGKWDSKQTDLYIIKMIEIIGHRAEENKGWILGMVALAGAAYYAYQKYNSSGEEEEKDKKKSVVKTCYPMSWQQQNIFGRNR